MIKLQFKLPQALISRAFTRRTVFHAPAFQEKWINRLMDIYKIWKPELRLGIRCGPLSKHPLPPTRHLPHLTIASIRPTFPGINPDQEMRQLILSDIIKLGRWSLILEVILPLIQLFSKLLE